MIFSFLFVIIDALNKNEARHTLLLHTGHSAFRMGTGVDVKNRNILEAGTLKSTAKGGYHDRHADR